MLPLFDMMMRAHNGSGMEAMASQFNLAQEQVAKAMAALTPAFSSGLKRSSTNPYDFTALMQSMASGDYARYFEDVGKAFTPQGIADGNAVLGQIFGSKEVSRAIAAQAAQFSGVGQEILKQMLPVMASTMMGGILKQSMGQMPEMPNPFTSGPMAAMMKPWMESNGFAPKPQAPAPSLFDNPFTQAMQAMFTPPPKPEAPKTDPMAGNPFLKAFQNMMAGGFNAMPQAPDTQAAPPAPGPGDYTAVVNSMFDSGLEVQKNYQKNMEAIFDGYMRGATGGPKSTA